LWIKLSPVSAGLGDKEEEEEEEKYQATETWQHGEKPWEN
jgi:hypothetical protein